MLKKKFFYSVVRLMDIKGWLLQVNILSFANKFNLLDLYMWMWIFPSMWIILSLIYLVFFYPYLELSNF